MLLRAANTLRTGVCMQSLVRRWAHDVHHGNMDQIPEKYQKFRPRTFDDFPVPQGSWKEANAKRQRRYNFQLFWGLSFLGATLTYIYVSEVFDLVLAPPMKNPPSEMMTK